MPKLVLASLTLALTSACATTLERKATDESPARQVTLLYVADLHGQLEPHPELFWNGGAERIETAGGFARVKAAIDAIRAERGGEVLVLDAGDTLQGSGAAALTEGAAIVPALNALELDLGVPGNWEVAYGPQVLKSRAEQIRHPLIAANIRDDASGQRLFEPYVIREVAGVKVAVVGFSDPDVPMRQPPAYSTGLRYDDHAELPALAKEVKAKGAQVVVLASHIGLSKAVALTEDVPGFDVHLSADTHERTYQPIERNGTWIVEPGAFGSFLGRLDLWVRDGKIVDRRWELIELTDKVPEDPKVKAIVEKSLAPLREKLDKPVGTAAGVLARYAVVETTLDHLLADALREATGTEIALSNGFRFGSPVLPGTLREKDLWSFYPVVTRLMTGKVTGRQLRDFWEREIENAFARDARKRFGGWLPRPSGLQVRFDSSAEPGQRVLDIKVNGEPLDDDRLYTLTACEREGDKPDTLCRIPNAKDTRLLEIDAHDAVRAYLARHPDVRRELEKRVVAIDIPEVLRTQL